MQFFLEVPHHHNASSRLTQVSFIYMCVCVCVEAPNMDLNFKGPLVDFHMLLVIAGHNCNNIFVGPSR